MNYDHWQNMCKYTCLLTRYLYNFMMLYTYICYLNIYSMLYPTWRSCNTSSVGQWLADFSFCLYTTWICASSQYYLASLLPVTHSLSREYVVFFRMCIIVSLKIQYKFSNSFLFFNFETLHFFQKNGFTGKV